MAILEVLKHPDPRLKKIAAPIEPAALAATKTRRLLDDMAETMYRHGGVGLAAVQVGYALQLIVLDVGQGLMEIANPVVASGFGQVVFEEACLSLPGIAARVSRCETIEVRYLDRNAEVRELVATGYLACCLQHEIDHLRGLLFVDRIPRVLKHMALKGYQKRRSRG